MAALGNACAEKPESRRELLGLAAVRAKSSARRGWPRKDCRPSSPAHGIWPGGGISSLWSWVGTSDLLLVDYVRGYFPNGQEDGAMGKRPFFIKQEDS